MRSSPEWSAPGSVRAPPSAIEHTHRTEGRPPDDFPRRRGRRPPRPADRRALPRGREGPRPRPRAQDILRIATAGSVDDGKSTLIGRLLYDSKAVFEDQY